MQHARQSNGTRVIAVIVLTVIDSDVLRHKKPHQSRVTVVMEHV